MSDMLDAPGIAAVLRKANDAEIKAGKAAMQKATSAEVKTFARHMVTEHTKNQEELAAVMKRAGIVPREIKTAKELERDTQSQEAKLQNKRGEGFDSAYIDAQIKDHKEVLEQIDRALKNNDRADEPFTAYLKKTRKHVEQHLQEAEGFKGSSEGGREGGRRRRY